MSKHTEAFRKQKKYASFLKFLDSLTEEEWEELEKKNEKPNTTNIHVDNNIPINGTSPVHKEGTSSSI